MEITKFIEHITRFFKKHKIKISESAMRAFISKRFLNRTLLKTMGKKQIINNLDVILKDVLRVYQERAKKSIRAIKLRDIDVKPVIRRKFCQIPPFC